jgi:hypothetical protein
VADRSVQPQFTQDDDSRRGRSRNCTIGRKHSDRHAQVEGRTCLVQIGWRQVDRDGRVRPTEPAVSRRRLHAFACFVDRCVWQSDDQRLRQAQTDISLNDNKSTFDADHDA